MSLEVIGYILIALGVFILIAQIQSNMVLSEFYQATFLRNDSDIEWRLGQIEDKLGDLVSTSIEISDNTANIPEIKRY